MRQSSRAERRDLRELRLRDGYCFRTNAAVVPRGARDLRELRLRDGYCFRTNAAVVPRGATGPPCVAPIQRILFSYYYWLSYRKIK
jgi:hypothetical protein